MVRLVETASTRSSRALSRDPPEGREAAGRDWAIVEQETEESLMAMHTSPEPVKAWAKVEPLLGGRPTARFLDVVIVGSAAVDV